jgi:hypothetical protein
MIRKKVLVGVVLAGAALALAGCSDDADIASQNNSKAADNFEVYRRIVFFNGITDKYLLEIEGYCAIAADAAESQLEVTCKTGPSETKKHFLGLSDNVTYLVEQLEPVETDMFHHRVTFKPEEIIPSIDLRTSNEG